MKPVVIAVILSLLLTFSSSVRAADTEKSIAELTERLNAFDSALKNVQKKLSNNYVGKTKIENVDNIDALVMLLQEIEQRVLEMTSDVEKLHFEQENLKKALETVKADNTLRFQEIDEKNKALEARFNVIETAITQAKEKQEKAEKAKKEAERKKKADAAAKAKAEKQRQEKLRTDYGQKTPKALYDEALAQLHKKEYKPAQEKFKAFLELHPKSDLAGNAQYWLGESYYAQAQYDKAAVAFADGYKNYATGQKAPDLLFKLGMTMSRLKKKDEACIAFDTFGKTYPKVSETIKKQIAAETKKLSCK